jgi:hypothetical protein
MIAYDRVSGGRKTTLEKLRGSLSAAATLAAVVAGRELGKSPRALPKPPVLKVSP